MPPHLVSRKRWGEVVTMEVSASVDMCQPDRLTTSDGSSPLTHCSCLPSYSPVTVAVIHRGYTCHRLLSTTCSQKKKNTYIYICIKDQSEGPPSKKSTNNICQRGWREKGTLLHCWWKCKLIQPLWKTVRRFLKKLGIKLSHDPTIPLLDI